MIFTSMLHLVDHLNQANDQLSPLSSRSLTTILPSLSAQTVPTTFNFELKTPTHHLRISTDSQSRLTNQHEAVKYQDGSPRHLPLAFKIGQLEVGAFLPLTPLQNPSHLSQGVIHKICGVLLEKYFAISINPNFLATILGQLQDKLPQLMQSKNEHQFNSHATVSPFPYLDFNLLMTPVPLNPLYDPSAVDSLCPQGSLVRTRNLVTAPLRPPAGGLSSLLKAMHTLNSRLRMIWRLCRARAT